jgi:transposase
MVTDGQVRKLRGLLDQGRSLAASARMTGMDEKTARSYRDDGRLPSQRETNRDYRTRVDPFAEVWPEVQQRLETEPKLQAVTLFSWLQERYPGQHLDSTRWTFERRVRLWRSTHGPNKAVTFPQEHHAGQIAASDFTVMNELGVKIAGSRFDHTLFHCVLTYSNVESVSLCFSESFEALSEGVQKAFWEFGGVPQLHRTDSLSAAIKNHSTKKELTSRYEALMRHYRVCTQHTNARCPNENGDVESLNGHIKNTIDQALLLRGSRDFESRDDYMTFVEQVVAKRNLARADRFAVEQQQLAPLPDHKIACYETLRGIRVRGSSTIQIRRNGYSVPSRLMGEKVDVTIHAEWIDVSHHGNLVQRMPRLTGVGGSAINYRHVIDSLLRKPGAFENYKYREDMFPTSHFRMAYDLLGTAHSAKVATRKYLEILAIAARESQDAVQSALRIAIAAGEPIDVESVRAFVEEATHIPPATDVEIESPDLSEFDSLLEHPDMESPCDDLISNQQEETSQDIRDDTSEAQVADGLGADDDQPAARIDRTVPFSAPAELPRPLPGSGRSSGDGAAQSPTVPFGSDDAGMRSQTPGADQTLDDSFASSGGQELGDVQLRSSSADRDSSVGEPPRRVVSEPSREPAHLRQAGRGQEPSAVCLGRTVDPAGSEHDVHDMQFASSAVADCQAGLAIAEDDQAAIELRGSVDRRPGLRAAKPRGDGSSVHPIGGTLRTGQCASDEQPGLQQVGSDLQGRDDHSGGDRPLRIVQEITSRTGAGG